MAEFGVSDITHSKLINNLNGTIYITINTSRGDIQLEQVKPTVLVGYFQLIGYEGR